MKVLLGSLATSLVLLVTGCADASSDAADDQADQPSTSASESTAPDEPTPTDDLQPQTVAILSHTAAGGEVDLHAVPVDDETSRHEFTAQFQRGSLDEQIAAAIDSATIPEGYTVMGAVVAIGCDVPPDVTASQSSEGWVFTPHKVAKPLQECFAPVTSVALVGVPA